MPPAEPAPKLEESAGNLLTKQPHGQDGRLPLPAFPPAEPAALSMDLILPRAAGLRLSLLSGMKVMGQVHSLTHRMAAQLQARGLMAQPCWLALWQ